MADESPFGLYLDIIRTLERLNMPYAIIGAFAGMSYGVTRLTADVDIVVDLNESHVQALAAAYPSPRYYADPNQMRDSIRRRIPFYIIDTSEGRKVDLIPLTMKPGYGFALENRIRRAMPAKEIIEAWFARPEDVIVGKLMAWKEGHSFKHEQDTCDILVAVRLNEEPACTAKFDFDYVMRWAIQLGTRVVQLWKEMKQAAGV